MPYSVRFKQKMIEKLTGPGAMSATALSKEVDVSQATLSRWLRDAKLGTMTKSKKPAKERRRRWSAADMRERCMGVPSSDLCPWNLLHDGTLVGAEREGGRLTLVVDIRYLRERFDEPGTAIVLELRGCTELAYVPDHGERVRRADQLAAMEIEILGATADGDAVRVDCNEGNLHLRYRELDLALDTGTPLTLEALVDAARSYWDDFERSGG